MKKMKMSLKTRLLIMSIVPVFLVGGFIIIFSSEKIEEGIQKEIMLGLQGMANSVAASYDGFNEGEYSVEDGCLMKGNFNVTENTEILDNIVEGTDYDVTVFYGKTRMATTLISNDTKERMLGVDASDKVASAVLNKGEEYKDYSMDINGENYYAYYLPIKNSSGDIVGMIFAGMPSGEAEAYIGSVIRSIAIFASIAEIIIIVITVLAVLTIVHSIKSAEVVINELSDGNLDIQINQRYLERSDEIGNMLRALSGFADKLNGIVSGMHRSSEVLIESGKKLEEMAQITSRTTEEINSAVGDISKGAVTQAEEIENATMHVVNIGEIIEHIVKSVSQLGNTAEQMKMAGDESADIIRELSDSNDRTTEAIERIGSQVYATNESVQSIKEAISMIRSIAEETNLLSLNASIEAARAGEHGRGFAVVASEIQQLAEQSNDSSTRIEEIIDSLLTESELTVQVMEEVKVIVQQQQRKLDDTKAKFEDVESGINVCREETDGIQDQTMLCDESREKVVDVIQGLSAISEENAASTQETNASMEELNSTVSVMAGAAGELMVLSEQLDESLRFFRRREDTM